MEEFRMTEKRFTYYEEDLGDMILPNCLDNGKNVAKSVYECVDLLNQLNDENEQLSHDATILICSNQEYREENEQLREALKNSYINEICENCKYGHYWISGSYGFGLEGEFECTKKHFGNDHWKCDGLTECDDFELDLKGDDVE